MNMSFSRASLTRAAGGASSPIMRSKALSDRSIFPLNRVTRYRFPKIAKKCRKKPNSPKMFKNIKNDQNMLKIAKNYPNFIPKIGSKIATYLITLPLDLTDTAAPSRVSIGFQSSPKDLLVVAIRK